MSFRTNKKIKAYQNAKIMKNKKLLENSIIMMNSNSRHYYNK